MEQSASAESAKSWAAESLEKGRNVIEQSFLVELQVGPMLDLVVCEVQC